MLKILRKKGVMKRIIWTIVVVIILIFGFGGTLYLLNDMKNASYAGKIFGQKVSFDEFENAFRDVRIQAIMRYGDNFRTIQQYLNLNTETWDRLILLHEVKKRRIQTSDDEVIARIEQYSFFQRDNQFDNNLYNGILRNIFRVSPRDFEKSIRDTIKFTKLFEQKTSAITVPENEIFEAYKKQNEKAQISYVFISPDEFKNNIQLSEEAIQQHYNENKLDFLSPPAINASYLSIDFPEPPPIEKKDSPSEDPTDEPASPPQISEEEKDAVFQTAEAIYQELLTNPDLSTMAKEYDLPLKTSGFFSMEQPNLSLGWSYEMLNQIFQLETNEISIPLETSKGYHIVQIQEKKEAYIPEYTEAKEKVREALLKKETRNIANQKAEEYLTALHQELDKSKLRDFPKAAKTLGLEILQTPIFTRGQYLPKIGTSKEFQEQAFQLTDTNKISQVVETDNGYCILHLDAYVAIEDADYQKNKTTLAEKLLNEHKNKSFNDFLTKLRLEAKLEDNITTLQEERARE